MDNKKIYNTITELIIRTKSSDMKWHRFSDGQSVTDILPSDYETYFKQLFKELTKDKVISGSIVDKIEFNQVVSYFASINNGYMYLYNFTLESNSYSKNDYRVLCVQINSNSRIVRLNTLSELQKELTQMAFIVEDKLNSVDVFLDSLFSN
ncbi:hypothetical protein Amet_2384 [Alkaliphilus metalliredigens QYMF]|uniref:Uncharacterized protein n=1 Tax=Alkaliphilus metalliredigens (strain QYMF) TaxID=293826 RepID=A6TQS0_ALKMQ|nr:hypothetical protein [Alkaliphilus metalliredigens]ABR48538.1 hypothetical protein Amet_2384 [Alkaliphilus metalliredigens QYMF]